MMNVGKTAISLGTGLVMALAVFLTGCPNANEGNTLVAVAWTAEARRAPHATAIDFEFDAPVAGLAASHISVTEGTGLVTPGALTGSGTSWSLAVTVERVGGVAVSIERPGISGMSRTVSFTEGDLTLTGTVSIDGNAAVWHTLIANVAGLGGTGTMSFQWYRGTGPIAYATGSTYVVRAADDGYAITVRVARAGNAGSVTSEPVGPVLPGFVRVEGGTFLMGIPDGVPNIYDWDNQSRPARYVTLSPFYMSRFQVTQGEWYDVMGFRRGHFTLPGDGWRNLPVEQVSWYDAIVFANRLSLARGLTPAYELPNVWPNPTSWSSDPAIWGSVPTGSTARWNNVRMVPGSTGYRLPTEAQWEFAARGGNQSRNYEFSGGNTASAVAWYGGNSGNRTHPVGTRASNELGLYDMSGNVWEWVWDWWGTYPSVAETDPVGASSGSYRVARGGSWFRSDWNLRPVLRHSDFPANRWFTVGVRLVRPASPSF